MVVAFALKYRSSVGIDRFRALDMKVVMKDGQLAVEIVKGPEE